jgi:hypothetical protein
MRRALLLPLALAACVAPAADPGAIRARQEAEWPVMIMAVDPATGASSAMRSGSGPAVIVSGAGKDRARAIAALAEFCGRQIDPEGFDTQYVHRDPATGDWWFDGFCE